MTRIESTLVCILAVTAPASWAVGQSSSLFLKGQARFRVAAQAASRPAPNGALRANAGAAVESEDNPNPVLTAVSLTTIAPPQPTVIRVHDLIGVIIRERMKYQSRARNQQESEWDVNAKLDAWFRIHDGRWLQQAFRGGEPTIGFSSENELQNKGNFDRQDVFETRVMAKVVDVKPNGNLIIAARSLIKVEDEYKYITVTGVCNKADIGPSRTITSDKIFDSRIIVEAEGSVTDATKRGWLKKLTDKFKPF